MKKLLDPGYWLRALRHPLVLLGLGVDLLPIYGVVVWGWNAVPLVLLYWLENVMAGVMTIPRIFISGATFGPVGIAIGVFMSAFFVFHYGLFCAVHGTFLMAFISMGGAMRGEAPSDGFGDAFMDYPAMILATLDSAPHVEWVAAAVLAFMVLVFVVEFIFKGQWKTTNPMAEMFSPYSRIIVLHIGIFAGAAALFLLGQPMVGVLALILFRAAWGVLMNSKSGGIGGFEQAAQQMGGREYFEKALRGEKMDPPSS